MPVLHCPIDLSERPPVDPRVSISGTDRTIDPQLINMSRAVRSLVDTGAGRSQVDLRIFGNSGIEQSAAIEIHTASTGDRPELMPLYLIDLAFDGDQPGLLARDLAVVGSKEMSGLEVGMLPGRDVLDRCPMVRDGVGRRSSLAYNPPPPIPSDA